MGGIAQIRGIRYLAVNVYPKSDGWRVAVLIRESGRPYPRLLRRLDDIPLPTDTTDLAGALLAASEALEELSREQRVDPTA